MRTHRENKSAPISNILMSNSKLFKLEMHWCELMTFADIWFFFSVASDSHLDTLLLYAHLHIAHRLKLRQKKNCWFNGIIFNWSQTSMPFWKLDSSVDDIKLCWRWFVNIFSVYLIWEFAAICLMVRWREMASFLILSKSIPN